MVNCAQTIHPTPTGANNDKFPAEVLISPASGQVKTNLYSLHYYASEEGEDFACSSFISIL